MADHRKHDIKKPKKQSAWQKAFSSGFTGKDIGLKSKDKSKSEGKKRRSRWN